MSSEVRAVIYARCSTDESRQNVDVQLAELRRHCQAMGWEFTEFSEYDSGFTGEQPVLQDLLRRIRRHEFNCLLVYSLDRLSRRPPSYTNRLLDELVEQQGIQFISKLEGIDSANELTWNVVRPIFSYFANLFSRNLSAKIRAGIQHKRERGDYRGGRPAKRVDADRLRTVMNGGKLSLRKLAVAYNADLPKVQRVSYQTVRKTLPTL